MIAAAVSFIAGCGSGSTDEQGAVRSVAQRYLRAVATGDGATACALLSPKGLGDGGYASRAACARDYAAQPLRQVFPIVKITLEGHDNATVVVGDAAVSDSGNDAVHLHLYGRRWLLDVG